MSQREYEQEEFEEAESTEEAFGLMVSRMHPKKDINEYLTIVRNKEVMPSAIMATAADVLREINSPSHQTIRWLGLDPDASYNLVKRTGDVTTRGIVNGKIMEIHRNMFDTRQVTAQEYAAYMIKINRGVAQAIVLGLLSKHTDNYRVSRDGTGRRGGIQIATSMVTGKQEVSMGMMGRFRRALGKG